MEEVQAIKVEVGQQELETCDAVTPEGDRTSVKTEEEPTRWIVCGNVIKLERQEDLVQQDAKTSPVKFVECDRQPPDGATGRPAAMADRLICSERGQPCISAVSIDASQNDECCTHIGVHTQHGVIGESRDQKQRQQLASRPIVRLHRFAFTDTDKSSYECSGHGKGELVLQENRHTSDQCYNCFMCGRAFRFRSHLVRHERTHTGERPYKCLTCGKALKDRTSLVRHERMHTGERPYQCLACGRAFTQRNSLLDHERTHSSERPFTCRTCGRAFTQSASLVRHERTHTVEPPYKCTTCGRAFRLRKTLLNHERTHTGERPYQCITCGRAFTQRTNLLRHERTHTGERPYKCLACGRAFTQRTNLLAHERTHDSEQPYKTRNESPAARCSYRAKILCHERDHNINV